MTNDWTEEFNAWVWKPPYWSWRVRGRSNATLRISPRRLSIVSRFRRGGWPEVQYEWRAVVVQTLQPLGFPAILFEIDEKLASCSVRLRRGRLRDVLERAGFAVIEVSRVGWEAPHTVAEDPLGNHAEDVPSAVTA